jgi:pyruvate dehydrogenase E1 component
MFATVPNCRVHDPAFAYEIAVLLDAGMRDMLQDQRDAFWYLTVGNANVPMPSMPDGDREAVRDGVLRGLYRCVGDERADLQLLARSTKLVLTSATPAALSR